MRSEPSHVADIAEAVQKGLDAYKAEKRDLGSVSVYVLVGVLIVLSFLGA